MSQIEVTRTVAAPADRVWEIITDLDESTSVISAIEAYERLDEGSAFGVGTRWRETRTMFGRQASEELEVTAVEPGRSYTVEGDSRGAHYTSQMIVTPMGADSSQLTMTFGGEASGAMAKILATTVGKLFEGATKKALQKDLEEIAAAAEGSG